MLNNIKIYFLSVFVFLLMTMISTSLSFEYELTPAIWPASGAALALVFQFGWPAMLGVATAAVISVWFLFWSQIVGVGFLVPIGITLFTIINSLSKVLITIWLINKFLGKNPLLARDRLTPVLFLIIVGPVSGAIGAIGTIPSFYLGFQGIGWDMVSTTLKWWLSFSLGGMVFTPWFLIVFAPNSVLNRLQKSLYFFLSSLGIGLLAILVILSKNQHQTEISEKLSEVSFELTQSILIRIENTINLLNAFNSYLNVSNELDLQAYQRYSKLLLESQNYITVLGWQPVVSHDQMQELENRLQEQGVDDFFIKDYNPDTLSFVPARKADLYVPIVFNYPLDNPQVIGLNYLSTSVGSSEYEKIKSIKAPSITEPSVRLNEHRTPAVGMFVPQIENGELVGFVSGLVIIDELFALPETSEQIDLLKVIWRDVTEEETKSMYETSPDRLYTLDYSKTERIQIHGRVWELVIQPTYFLMQKSAGSIGWLLVVSGAIITSLLQLFALILMGINREIRTEVASKTERLQVALDEAENATKAKSQFLANMSHEIRTPLNAILGFTEIAREEKNPSAVHAFLDNIATASRSLSHLVNEILDFSKIEAGKLDLDIKPFRLSELKADTCAIFQNQMTMKGLGFQFILDEDFVVLGDQMRIQQVLINFCSNALKFTKEGEVNVSLRNLYETDTHIRIQCEISDTGIGIPADRQKELFTEFTQADSSTSRKYGGSGLGLAISAKLVSLMNGNVWLTSEEGEGSQFFFELPLKKSKRVEETQTESPLKETYKILLVDDNDVNLVVTSAMLKKLNQDVMTAESGFVALDIIQNADIDLIFMDMQMPEMDGVETTRLIKASPQHSSIKVVGLTANATAEDRIKCLNAGMLDHLSKPVSKSQLAKCLKRWLENS